MTHIIAIVHFHVQWAPPCPWVCSAPHVRPMASQDSHQCIIAHQHLDQKSQGWDVVCHLARTYFVQHPPDHCDPCRR